MTKGKLHFLLMTMWFCLRSCGWIASPPTTVKPLLQISSLGVTQNMSEFERKSHSEVELRSDLLSVLM